MSAHSHVADARAALADATMIVARARQSLGDPMRTLFDIIQDVESAQRCIRRALACLDAELVAQDGAR